LQPFNLLTFQPCFNGFRNSWFPGFLMKKHTLAKDWEGKEPFFAVESLPFAGKLSA